MSNIKFHIFTLYSSKSDFNGDKYIQRSIVPTYHYQPSLPRLPIPKLEDTCRRYLNSQKVILSPEGFKDTEKLVEDFKKHEGQGKKVYNVKNLHVCTIVYNLPEKFQI